MKGKEFEIVHRYYIITADRVREVTRDYQHPLYGRYPLQQLHVLLRIRTMRGIL